MLVFRNDAISPNECYAPPPLDIDIIPHPSFKYDSISDVSETSQGPSHTSNENASPQE